MTLNDFLVACVDAVFNTDITVKNWWPQLKKERRKLGDLFLKTILNMLRAKGGAWAPSGEYAQLGVQDSNLSRKLGKAVNLPGHPLVQNFKLTSYLQESLQLASQLNSLHSGEYATQGRSLHVLKYIFYNCRFPKIYFRDVNRSEGLFSATDGLLLHAPPLRAYTFKRMQAMTCP